MTGTTQDLKRIREECQALVRKRALLSAGAAVIPVPLFDLVVDAGILMDVLPEINRRFGLAPEHIEKMGPDQQATVWQVARQRGSQLIGIVLTRQLVRRSLQAFAGRLLALRVVQWVPFAGQVMAAGVGYFVMRKMIYHHIDDCYAVAKAAQA